MKVVVKKGRTSLLTRIFLQDSSSTTGAGLTGLTSASSGLVCYRARDDDGNAGATQITLSAGTKGTWSSGGFVEKDATNMPGVYEFGVPDAALATGSETVDIMFKGATNLAPCVLEIQLVAYDPQAGANLGLTDIDATISSRLAASSAPTNWSAFAITAGGAVTVGTNNDKTGYTVSTNNDKTGYSLASPPGIRKNVALANFQILMTDSTNHNPLTGATVSVTRSIDGGAFGAGTIANILEISNGWYKFDFGAGDLNGTNIAVRCTATGADDLDFTIHTDP